MLNLFKFIYRWIVIPKGDYCYKMKKVVYSKDKDRPFFKTRTCHYWCWDERYPDDKVGYCKYLKVGDRDDNSSGFLWDQVKECGVNKYDEDDR